MAATKLRADLHVRPHALYRFFGAGGTLLYIGITADLPTRLHGHRDDKPWWLGVTNVTLEHYPSRDSVLEAERRAIVAEKPLYNTQHNEAGRIKPSVPETVSSFEDGQLSILSMILDDGDWEDRQRWEQINDAADDEHQLTLNRAERKVEEWDADVLKLDRALRDLIALLPAEENWPASLERARSDCEEKLGVYTQADLLAVAVGYFLYDRMPVEARIAADLAAAERRLQANDGWDF